MRISDWSSDVCSSDLCAVLIGEGSDLSIIEYTAEILRPASHRRHFLRQDCSPEWRQGIAGAAHVPDQRKHEEKGRSEEHTSELQSLMRISYAVFCLKKKKI